MENFKFNLDGIEVKNEVLLALVNSMPSGKETRVELLKEQGVVPEEGKWFNAQSVLNVHYKMAETLGSMNLFMVGKAIIENAVFPPMNNLEEALNSIDVAYHMNHRKNGEEMFNPNTGGMLEGIGHYSVTEYNEELRQAVVVCSNPYPSKFDEGIITQIV